MRNRRLCRASLAASLVTLLVLVWLTIVTPITLARLLPSILFGALIIFTDVFGVRLAGGAVSLLPMSTVAAYLVVGPMPTGWAAFLSALVHGLIRYSWAEQLDLPRESDRMRSITITAVNATMHTASILVGGAVYRALGGDVPLTRVEPDHLLPLTLLALTYLAVNHLLVSPVIAVQGREVLHRYLQSLPTLIFYEGGPLIFAPLMALIYTRLGLVPFVLFALSMVITSLITRNLARTSQRLERHVRELGSLQAVGRALSASLDVEAVVSAIYDQVTELMPARNCYVALYDPDVDEVSFPLAVEGGERVQWRSRRAGSGLTEYVLRTREPLLIRRGVASTLEELGVDAIGRLAECWLGVPMLSGDDTLGVIAVQSYEAPEAYDTSHQEVLATIAAQAAVAIQNARLYARTDEALARRVRELDSILRTTREGIILLDTDWRVVAVNRALADFLDVAQLDLTGRLLRANSDEERSLVSRLGYTPEDLRADCEALAEGPHASRQALVALGSSGRHIERTLAPVCDREGAITGWLLVFRDITEEVELARLKDDMTHMLVHDLRSPLTVLDNSFHFIEDAFVRQDSELFSMSVGMAKRSSDRMLSLVNDLLDIRELESDQLDLDRKVVDARSLLAETMAHFTTLAASACIRLEIAADPDLPRLHVDPGLIRRILSNLLDNAIKFTPDGGCVRLWARFDREAAPNHLLVGVSDDGPGIPEEERQKLFEKFQRVSSTRGRRPGSGLGLPFCKLAVEAHGGRIWVESPSSEVGSPETGSTFVMTLPTRRQPE